MSASALVQKAREDLIAKNKAKEAAALAQAASPPLSPAPVREKPSLPEPAPVEKAAPPKNDDENGDAPATPVVPKKRKAPVKKASAPAENGAAAGDEPAPAAEADDEPAAAEGAAADAPPPAPKKRKSPAKAPADDDSEGGIPSPCRVLIDELNASVAQIDAMNRRNAQIVLEVSRVYRKLHEKKQN